MSFLQDELDARELPALLKFSDGTAVTPSTWRKRRAELLEILYQNEYGRTPQAPKAVRWKNVEESQNAYAGKAIQRRVEIAFDTPKGEFTFPVNVFLPKAIENPPAFIEINFRPDLPDRYCPIEEIIDNGFALVVFCYQDVIRDSIDGNYDQGLGAMFREAGTARTPDEWGKIGMWAYSCSRVLDYLTDAGEVNAQRVAVVGHSRLGKTALWAGAQDERFFLSCSNDSGFGGAAIHKRGHGERVADFIRCGSWDWYCETFKTYLNKEDENTVWDQHMLLACIAPRHICVGSAELDRGADPHSEFLNCYAQTPVYHLLGLNGLVTEDRYPDVDSSLDKGMISYHIRRGLHFFSRTDWLYYMQYFKQIL